MEEAFKDFRLDLVPLQKALQENTLSLSQAPMTYFSSALSRRDNDDDYSSPSATLPQLSQR